MAELADALDLGYSANSRYQAGNSFVSTTYSQSRTHRRFDLWWSITVNFGPSVTIRSRSRSARREIQKCALYASTEIQNVYLAH